MESESPKGVLFDVANVIIPWHPDNLFKKVIPDETRRRYFYEEIVTRDWHVRHDYGVSFQENRKALVTAHPDFAEEITFWGERFTEMFAPAIAGTERVIDRLKSQGVKVFALTNMPAEVWPYVQTLSPVFERFDGMVVSAHEKMAKPEERIFQLALSRMGLAAQHVLFIDDTLENIYAAQQLGFLTHHYTTEGDLDTCIRALFPYV